MPWDGRGVFSRDNGSFGGSDVWQKDRASGIPIRADRHDDHDQDLANALNNCLTRDGQNAPTANLSMSGNRHTNVGDATATNEYATLGQIRNGGASYAGGDNGTTNALEISLDPPLTEYVAGMMILFRSNHDVTGSATLEVDGLGERNLLSAKGASLESGDISDGDLVMVSYTLGDFRVISATGTAAYLDVGDGDSQLPNGQTAARKALGELIEGFWTFAQGAKFEKELRIFLDGKTGDDAGRVQTVNLGGDEVWALYRLYNEAKKGSLGVVFRDSVNNVDILEASRNGVFHRGSRVYTRQDRFESGEHRPSSHTDIEEPHGFDGKPLMAWIVARCVSATNGFEPGEEVAVCSVDDGTTDGRDHDGVSPTWDEENVYFSVGNNTLYVNAPRDSGGAGNISHITGSRSDNWRLVVKAIAA